MDIFHKNFESWSDNHLRIRLDEIGNKNALDFLNSQTDKMIQSQSAVADKIVSGQKEFSEEFNNFSQSIKTSFSELIGISGKISVSLDDIKNTLDWGFEEVIWNLELENDHLGRILATLEAPLTTQAKELRKRAEVAYKNGWIDDAVSDFLASEKKNIYDFAIHKSLADIYLFEKKDPIKSLEYCDKAIKYAFPYSKEIVADLYSLKGFIYYLSNDFLNAIKFTSEALKISSNPGRYYFKRSQYYAKLGNFSKAINDLSVAIALNRYFAVKVWSEEDFLAMKNEIVALLDGISSNNFKQVSSDIGYAKKILDQMENAGFQDDDYEPLIYQLSLICEQFKNKTIQSSYKTVDMSREFYKNFLPNFIKECICKLGRDREIIIEMPDIVKLNIKIMSAVAAVITTMTIMLWYISRYDGDDGKSEFFSMLFCGGFFATIFFIISPTVAFFLKFFGRYKINGIDKKILILHNLQTSKL